MVTFAYKHWSVITKRCSLATCYLSFFLFFSSSPWSAPRRLDSVPTTIPGSALFSMHSGDLNQDVTNVYQIELKRSHNDWIPLPFYLGFHKNEQHFVLMTKLQAKGTTYSFRHKFVFDEGNSELSKTTTVVIGKQSINFSVSSTLAFTPPLNCLDQTIYDASVLFTFSFSARRRRVPGGSVIFAGDSFPIFVGTSVH